MVTNILDLNPSTFMCVKIDPPSLGSSHNNRMSSSGTLVTIMLVTGPGGPGGGFSNSQTSQQQQQQGVDNRLTSNNAQLHAINRFKSCL